MALFTFPSQAVTISGGATEAKQDIIITALGDINTELDSQTTLLTSLDGKDFATQTTSAALLTELQLKADLTETQPVSAASLPLPTGAATEATLSSLDGKDFATQTTSAALLTELQLKADLTETQPVSAASLPLPSGAATEATLSSIDGKDFATETTLAAQATATKQDEQTAILKPNVIDQIDTTPLLDTSSTNIPGSASLPVEVIASTAAAAQKVLTVEDIGEFIGLYTGAASSEVLLCVLPLGGGEVQVDIPASTRISLRSMTATAISTGNIAINLIG